jgi:hypothetical protein
MSRSKSENPLIGARQREGERERERPLAVWSCCRSVSKAESTRSTFHERHAGMYYLAILHLPVLLFGHPNCLQFLNGLRCESRHTWHRNSRSIPPEVRPCPRRLAPAKIQRNQRRFLEFTLRDGMAAIAMPRSPVLSLTLRIRVCEQRLTASEQ